MSGYLRLQAVQIVGGALRVSGGLEDATLVAFERAQPRLDISGVIVARLNLKARSAVSTAAGIQATGAE